MQHYKYRGRIRDTSVVYRCATGWMIGGSNSGRGWGFFSSSPCSERLWGPPSLLPSGYQGLFTWGVKRPAVKLTTHLHLVPRSRMHGAVPTFPNMHSWCSTQLKQRDNFTFTLPNLMLHNPFKKSTHTRIFKKFSTLYGIRKFITVLTRARHWAMSCARRHEFTQFFFKIHFNIIFLSTPMYRKWCHPFRFPE
jgi:hypothetical protein